MFDQLWIVAQTDGLAGGASVFVMWIVIFAIFWLIVFRPAQKQRKELQNLIENLQKGDRIITNGGLYAKVVKSDGPVLVVEITDGVRIRLARSAVAGLEATDEPADKKGS
ncbi:MAG: preprotein translocase subunit YajC [Acidobacteriota bacterium]